MFSSSANSSSSTSGADRDKFSRNIMVFCQNSCTIKKTDKVVKVFKLAFTQNTTRCWYFCCFEITAFCFNSFIVRRGKVSHAFNFVSVFIYFFTLVQLTNYFFFWINLTILAFETFLFCCRIYFKCSHNFRNFRTSETLVFLFI